MVDKTLIKRLILEYQQFATKVKHINRDIPVDITRCNVFVGLRRAGKSYLMYQCISRLIELGHTPESILYLNFEDDRLPALEVGDLDIIKTSYEELYADKPVFFLDEVQTVPGWQKFARRLADTGYLVFITGSNASMLSAEIATVLGGRYAITEVFPYSFREYLQAKGEEVPRNWELLPCPGIKRVFSEYFTMGGLPEVATSADEFKRQWLSGLFDRIYFGDLVTRHGIRKPGGVRVLVRKLAESVGQPLSANRAASIITAAGEKIKSETVAEYLGFIENSWLTFSLENHAAKLADKVGTRKYYFVDNGLISLFKDEMRGELLENLVAVTLRKQYGDRLFYYLHNIEVDFYIPEEGVAVQASYTLNDEGTLRREIHALDALHSRFPLSKAMIITYDDERQIRSASGLDINVVPLWKWLLAASRS